MKKLIDYIIKEPTVSSPKRGHKFPFIASEILSCEANVIVDKFFQEQEEKLERNMSFFSLSDSFIITSTQDNIDTFVEKREA